MKLMRMDGNQNTDTRTLEEVRINYECRNELEKPGEERKKERKKRTEYKKIETRIN